VSSSSSVERDAPAKLNLFLEVLARRPDGYHEIDSVFQTISLCDRVRVERAESIELSVEGDAPEGRENLAWRAAELLGVGARIHLTKRIPPGSGLGGGSSDAAAVLLALDALYGLGLGPRGLLPHAARLGADVPFFLAGGLARCRGIGERVEPLPTAREAEFLLAAPAFETSTTRVYGALGTGLTGERQPATVFLDRWFGMGEAAPARFFNRLQDVAEALDPRLKRMREALERATGAAFSMTGSGSAYFAEWRDSMEEPGAIGAAGTPIQVWRVRTTGR